MPGRNLSVNDLMTHKVISLNADDHLDIAEMLMRTGRIRHLPVVRDGKLVGLVTHRDLLRASVRSSEQTLRGRKLEFEQGKKVGDIMVAKVLTVTPDTPALTAARILFEKRIGCLVAVSANQEPVGIITESDFLELAVKALESLAAGRSSAAPPPAPSP